MLPNLLLSISLPDRRGQLCLLPGQALILLLHAIEKVLGVPALGGNSILFVVPRPLFSENLDSSGHFRGSMFVASNSGLSSGPAKLLTSIFYSVKLCEISNLAFILHVHGL